MTSTYLIFFFEYIPVQPCLAAPIVILHHYPHSFKKTQSKYTNGEFTESCHSSLRKSEETHWLKIVKKLGTPIHQQRSLQSLSFFNSKRAGYITPLRMRKKSVHSPNSPFSGSPSPLSSTSSPFTKVFSSRYPEAAQMHFRSLSK